MFDFLNDVSEVNDALQFAVVHLALVVELSDGAVVPASVVDERSIPDELEREVGWVVVAIRGSRKRRISEAPPYSSETDFTLKVGVIDASVVVDFVDQYPRIIWHHNPFRLVRMTASAAIDEAAKWRHGNAIRQSFLQITSIPDPEIVQGFLSDFSYRAATLDGLDQQGDRFKVVKNIDPFS